MEDGSILLMNNGRLGDTMKTLLAFCFNGLVGEGNRLRNFAAPLM